MGESQSAEKDDCVFVCRPWRFGLLMLHQAMTTTDFVLTMKDSRRHEGLIQY